MNPKQKKAENPEKFRRMTKKDLTESEELHLKIQKVINGKPLWLGVDVLLNMTVISCVYQSVDPETLIDAFLYKVYHFYSEDLDDEGDEELQDMIERKKDEAMLWD